jgi:hypothetical protein
VLVEGRTAGLAVGEIILLRHLVTIGRDHRIGTEIALAVYVTNPYY